MHRDEPDGLVQLAILHAEFEALHPFLDGNGRMGRMLVPLFMWQRELIRQPAFYISAYSKPTGTLTTKGCDPYRATTTGAGGANSSSKPFGRKRRII